MKVKPMKIKNLSWTFPMLCRLKKQTDNHILQGYCLPRSSSKAVAVYNGYSFTSFIHLPRYPLHLPGLIMSMEQRLRLPQVFCLSNSVKEIRNARWTSYTERKVTLENVSTVNIGTAHAALQAFTFQEWTFLCLSSFFMFVAGNAFPLNFLLKIRDVVTLEDKRRQTNNE